MDNEIINPVEITDNETGDVYTLDFSRDSIGFMARQKFEVDETIISFVAEKGPDFFFYAFRKNHKQVGRNKTDALYKKMGGFAPSVVTRLVELYHQALNSNSFIQTDEDLEKNELVTVKLL